MAYQPKWVRGVVSGEIDRECAARYEAIRSVASTYARPFTVWDIGASLGYFGLRLAYELGAVSVMVDSRPQLIDVCRENKLPTTIAMTHRLSSADLRELAQCEAPDMVLALNALHHMPDWREALGALLALGDNLIIETPGRGDTGSANYDRAMDILNCLESQGLQPIAHFPSHVTPRVMRPMFLVERRKTALSAGYAYVERVRKRGRHPVRNHWIASFADSKTITYVDGESRDWHPGMNLWNWLQLGGAWPERKTIGLVVAAATSGLKTPHGDIAPWNYILQGQSVALIDSGHRHNDDAAGLARTLAYLSNPELAYA